MTNCCDGDADLLTKNGIKYIKWNYFGFIIWCNYSSKCPGATQHPDVNHVMGGRQRAKIFKPLIPLLVFSATFHYFTALLWNDILFPVDRLPDPMWTQQNCQCWKVTILIVFVLEYFHLRLYYICTSYSAFTDYLTYKHLLVKQCDFQWKKCPGYKVIFVWKWVDKVFLSYKKWNICSICSTLICFQ